MQIQIQINTDNHIKGTSKLSELAISEVESALEQVSRHVTRVEVHLSDENSHKGGAHDKRCVMEARLEGHQPLAVTADGESIDMAIGEAAEKLKHAVDHTIGRAQAINNPQKK